MKTNLHHCYMCAVGPGPTLVCSLVSGSVSEAPGAQVSWLCHTVYFYHIFSCFPTPSRSFPFPIHPTHVLPLSLKNKNKQTNRNKTWTLIGVSQPLLSCWSVGDIPSITPIEENWSFSLPREIQLILNWKLHSYWLAFIVSEGATHTTREVK